MIHYRNKKIEYKALEFLRSLPPNLLKFPFDIITAISTLKNCSVRSYQEFARRHNICEGEVIAFCQSDTGCTHKDDVNGNFIIMYNDSQSIVKERKTFTLAHELGHIKPGHFDIIGNSILAQNSSVYKTLEREANHFATCLLCPLPIIYKLNPQSIQEIQRFFGLSFEAAEIAWNDFKHYNKNHYIAWHNDFIRLFMDI